MAGRKVRGEVTQGGSPLHEVRILFVRGLCVLFDAGEQVLQARVLEDLDYLALVLKVQEPKLAELDVRGQLLLLRTGPGGTGFHLDVNTLSPVRAEEFFERPSTEGILDRLDARSLRIRAPDLQRLFRDVLVAFFEVAE